MTRIPERNDMEPATATPEEEAGFEHRSRQAAVVFLVAPDTGFITGETLTIDGGAWLGKGPFGFV